jgi:hypothetical protein
MNQLKIGISESSILKKSLNKIIVPIIQNKIEKSYFKSNSFIIIAYNQIIQIITIKLE